VQWRLWLVLRGAEDSRKKELVVEVPEYNPQQVDYSWFINQMTQQIQGNIKAPGYVDLLTPDFTTSNKTHKLVSGITVMMSVQEYFKYTMHMISGGIPAVELLGRLEDWQALRTQVVGLEDLLRPILGSLRLAPAWWRGVEEICDQLVRTYEGKAEPSWWCSILGQSNEMVTWYGGSGMTMGESLELIYDGWFITDMLSLEPQKSGFRDIKSGLVTVPMKVGDATGRGLPTEDATFIAGIAGLKITRPPSVDLLTRVVDWCTGGPSGTHPTARWPR
jgi:hypothetical protein